MHKPKRANAGFPKVFLGGLPANVTESDLRAFFVRYGQVMEVVIMYDQEKKKSRGFGFLSVSDSHQLYYLPFLLLFFIHHSLTQSLIIFLLLTSQLVTYCYFYFSHFTSDLMTV